LMATRWLSSGRDEPRVGARPGIGFRWIEK
jgi:hypothetical protein